jgi:hypothetical protein
MVQRLVRSFGRLVSSARAARSEDAKTTVNNKKAAVLRNNFERKTLFWFIDRCSCRAAGRLRLIRYLFEWLIGKRLVVSRYGAGVAAARWKVNTFSAASVPMRLSILS